MITILDPEELEARIDRLYQKLKRKRIEACEQCRGTGKVVIETDWVDDLVPISKTKHCACKREVLFDLSLYEAGVPRELWKADEIVPDFNVDHFALLRRYGEGFTGAVIADGLSLLLTGENGTGKTSSATVAVIGALRAGRTAALVSWPDLVNVARQARFDSHRYGKIVARLRRALVVFDEIGKESALNKTDDFPQQLLDSFVRERRGDGLPTILITNLSVGEFSRRYGESVSSLVLSPPFNVLEYEPGDYRTRISDSWATLEGGK